MINFWILVNFIHGDISFIIFENVFYYWIGKLVIYYWISVYFVFLCTVMTLSFYFFQFFYFFLIFLFFSIFIKKSFLFSTFFLKTFFWKFYNLKKILSSFFQWKIWYKVINNITLFELVRKAIWYTNEIFFQVMSIQETALQGFFFQTIFLGGIFFKINCFTF